MAFHQLEKVLARAATNRSFRDELAAGDADLDELGLSDDEQSVLSELVASSGAGLDAVLNVVAALPASAGGSPAMQAVQAMQNVPTAAIPTQANQVPGHSAGPTAATTTPAFALMTPTVASAGAVTPALAGATPAAPAAIPTAMPPGYPMSAQGIPAGYPMPAAGTQSGYPMQTGATPAGYQGPGAAVSGGYGQVSFRSNQDATAMPAQQSQSNGSTAGAPAPQRMLDAGDVGRPVVARLPFGMDVVK